METPEKNRLEELEKVEREKDRARACFELNK